MRPFMLTMSLGMIAVAGSADAGTCKDADLDRDGRITKQDAQIVAEAIVILDADLDYNEDGETVECVELSCAVAAAAR